MMPEMSLFNTSPQVAGFKLDYMEVWNWGTFDDSVYRLNPQGNNSLLTGANASGKSTLIDALLTLLVPLKRQRFYNQSSGVEKKGNRTEESYFFGNYGNKQQDGNSGTTSLRLRGKDKRSVLLASFCNVDDRVVTLFQVRYYTGEELKVVFGIARKPLSIKEDFADFDQKGVWRKHLDKELNGGNVRRMIEFFDGPMAYEQKIIELFGMRSEKALTLFNQIVGVKVLDDLDSFIRDNMLEMLDAEEKYQELRENFQNLMEAKINIDKTKEQIRQLEPIDALAKEIQTIDSRIKELQHEKDVAAYWFACRTVGLCDEELFRCKTELRRLDDEVKALMGEKKRLNDEQTRLSIAIERDEVGQQIKELEREIIHNEKERNKRHDKLDSYNKLAQKVSLVVNPDASAFDGNRMKAKGAKDTLQKKIDKELSEIKRLTQNALDEIENDIKQHVETIRYLKDHKNNISGRVAEIRDEIIEHVGATTDEIPFVGELISVKDSERNWEYAIERILHNFALRLIVPEKYYQQVNEYVNNHDLRGRIVYQRYRGIESLREFENRQISGNSLLKKINLKEKSQYIDWLEDRLYAEFNYACVDSLADFSHISEKVVTKEGLIKSKGGKHEKDDRPETQGRSHYVLGWDNREKIAELRGAYDKLVNQQKIKKEELKRLDAQKNELETQKEAFHDLLKYEKYDEIDWQSYAQIIQEKNEVKKHFEETNDRIKALQEQLKDVQKSLACLEEKYKEIIRQQTRFSDRSESVEKLRNDNAHALALMNHVETDSFEENHSEILLANINEINAKRSSIQNAIEQDMNNQRDLKNKKNSECQQLINAFKYPSEEVTLKYRDWRSDVNSLTGDVEYVGEYQTFLTRLYQEDLPSFESKFNRYLHETITNDVNKFRIFFENWNDSISKTINQLNSSLRDIDFGSYPNTYIQLEATKKLNVDTADFRKLLNEAIPNLREVESSIDGRRVHFEQHIEPLMKRLQEEPWRSAVMDVRGWFTYKAVEYFKEDNQKRNTYESMGQLSGGEKAQLTYTILGSAIAYQFGLTKHGLDSSFRFIAIDEAFRAQDEDKARYLISLCKQLHLQLLVVTPSDNIHIVENDISYVHYVERKGNTSVLYNMPISKFIEERETFIEI